LKTLAELQAQCAALGITPRNGQSQKETYIAALRDYYWRRNYPQEPLPVQIHPMLLADWEDLPEEQAAQVEQDDNGWIVQPKFDGVRALLHVTRQGIRITGRCISDVTFRLGEFQENLPHLGTGWEGLAGTVLDGELVSPAAVIDTGKTRTAHALQATVAVLATSPENARYFQDRHGAWLAFHAFDILQHEGEEVTRCPLRDRLQLLEESLHAVHNPHVKAVPTFSIIKATLHASVLDEGGEGTVWKQLDQPYEPGRRVKHWVKRKKTLQIEGFVSGFKPGTPGKGNGNLVGAVEFSGVDTETGAVRPVGWVSGWDDSTRLDLTVLDVEGRPQLNPRYLDRRALLCGQEWSAKSRRLRSARLVRWL
jgi:ATP-dependent DNA ligase